MPRERSQALWLRQVEPYLKDTGMAGLVSAWAAAEGVSSQGGCGDAPHRRMPPI